MRCGGCLDTQRSRLELLPPMPTERDHLIESARVRGRSASVVVAVVCVVVVVVVVALCGSAVTMRRQKKTKEKFEQLSREQLTSCKSLVHVPETNHQTPRRMFPRCHLRPIRRVPRTVEEEEKEQKERRNRTSRTETDEATRFARKWPPVNVESEVIFCPVVGDVSLPCGGTGGKREKRTSAEKTTHRCTESRS